MSEDPQLPDGVYLGLDDKTYFKQKRLGSTDLAKLFLQREGWWWQSWLNPLKDNEPTEAQNFGRALHRIILEGVDAYERTFVIGPDKADFKGLCVTIEDILTRLSEDGIEVPKTATKSKPKLIQFATEVAPEIPIWDVIVARAKEENGERATVTSTEDSHLRTMSDAIRNHPEIGPLFAFSHDHVPLAEISIFYTDQWGVPRRARLDELVPTVTIDLKSLANFNGRPLSFATGEHMAKMGYHIQMADHHMARHVLYRFIREGKVFDGTTEERNWLARFPDEARNWGYVWLFYQKPDQRKGMAPIIFPWEEDYGGDLHRRGLRAAVEAIQTYRRCMATFGPDKPWLRSEPIHSTADGAVDRVFIPHWIGGDTPLPNEEELLNP